MLYNRKANKIRDINMYSVKDCLDGLKQLMDEKGLSVQRACKIAKISETTWYNWKRGKKNGTQPTIRMLNKIESALRNYQPENEGK